MARSLCVQQNSRWLRSVDSGQRAVAEERHRRDRGEKVARLEDEIRRLRSDMGGVPTTKWASTQTMLTALQHELQELDPKSPYAYIKL
jgi:hypothetical protein